MKKYDPDAHCPKCDWPGASTKYIPGYTVPRTLGEVGREYLPATLSRQCGRCGYRWNELPLDSKEEDNG